MVHLRLLVFHVIKMLVFPGCMTRERAPVAIQEAVWAPQPVCC